MIKKIQIEKKERIKEKEINGPKHPTLRWIEIRHNKPVSGKTI